LLDVESGTTAGEDQGGSERAPGGGTPIHRTKSQDRELAEAAQFAEAVGETPPTRIEEAFRVIDEDGDEDSDEEEEEEGGSQVQEGGSMINDQSFEIEFNAEEEEEDNEGGELEQELEQEISQLSIDMGVNYDDEHLETEGDASFVEGRTSSVEFVKEDSGEGGIGGMLPPRPPWFMHTASGEVKVRGRELGGKWSKRNDLKRR